MENEFRVKEDVEACCEALGMGKEAFASLAGVSLRTLLSSFRGRYSQDTLEKIYGAIYRRGLRLNAVKGEMYGESLRDGSILLFHGSKDGLKQIREDGSRANCDFGRGFYCSRRYASALCFLESYEHSSVYLYEADLRGLDIAEIGPGLEWMLIVCHHRGMIGGYEAHPLLQKSLSSIEGKDVIIAPIADNRMFQIMRDFGEGNITDLQAIHALSASRLGNQYVFKTGRALEKLTFRERLYCPASERDDSLKNTGERKNAIDTKLRLASREFRGQGLYIDEVFK